MLPPQYLILPKRANRNRVLPHYQSEGYYHHFHCHHHHYSTCITQWIRSHLPRHIPRIHHQVRHLITTVTVTITSKYGVFPSRTSGVSAAVVLHRMYCHYLLSSHRHVPFPTGRTRRIVGSIVLISTRTLFGGSIIDRTNNPPPLRK